MRQYELEENQELKIQVGDEEIELELRRGMAELHGTEMLANKSYKFKENSSIAVFTYHGALIELSGNPPKCHVGQQCDYMRVYLDIHAKLEKMREEAENIKKTPICIVCKPYDSTSKVGKSTLCKILLNYAARRGRTPVFVNLDPEKGIFGLPGTIGALSIESPIDIENGLALNSPMLLHFGHTTPNSNFDPDNNSTLFYTTLVENLAKIVHSKLEQDSKTFSSGVIINACSWEGDVKNDIIIHACKAFKSNLICVVNGDEMYVADLQKSLDEEVEIINVPRTVSIRAVNSQLELRQRRINEYFYGTFKNRFYPNTSEIKFAHIHPLIYMIKNPKILSEALMPLGARTQNEQLKIEPYNCQPDDLLNRLLALSFCTLEEVRADPNCVLRSNIMGFICVTMIRKEDNSLRILAPQQLPKVMNKVLLVSEVRYLDSHE